MAHSPGRAPPPAARALLPGGPGTAHGGGGSSGLCPALKGKKLPEGRVGGVGRQQYWWVELSPTNWVGPRLTWQDHTRKMDKQAHKTKESLPSPFPQHQGLAGWRENLGARARTQKYAGMPCASFRGTGGGSSP